MQKNRWLPAVAAGAGALRLRGDRARSGLRPRVGAHAGASGTAALWRLTGRQDLHLQRGHRRPLHRAGADASRRRARGLLSMFLVDAGAPGLVDASARAHGSPPPGRGALRRSAGRAARRRGPGATSSPWRPWTRSGPSVGAAACGLAQRALDEALRWSAGPPAVRQAPGRASRPSRWRSPTCTSSSRPRACSCGARPGSRTRARSGSPARRRPRSSSRPRWPSAWSTARSRSTAARASCGARRWSGSTARCARLRIYEGASEIQKLVVAGSLLKDAR